MFGSNARQSIFSLRTAALATLIAVSAAGAAQASSPHNHPLIKAHRLGARDVLSVKSPKANVTFTTLDNPGDPTFNQLLSIDDAGTIAGYFGSGSQGHPNQAYTIKPPYTTFVPANVPASTQTQIQSYIHPGTSSGFWAATNTGMDENFGFVEIVNGAFAEYIQVNNPATPAGASVNQVLGINEAGHAVGFYLDINGNAHAFVYSVGTSSYTPITIPGTTAVSAFGISANNLICGDYVNTAGTTKAFLFNLSTLASIHYAYPGSTNTQFLGVNASGLAVGFYMGSDNLPHGLVYNSATGVATVINDPNGAGGTTLNGINDSGEVVGFYTDAAGNTHGMIVLGL